MVVGAAVGLAFFSAFLWVWEEALVVVQVWVMVADLFSFVGWGCPVGVGIAGVYGLGPVVVPRNSLLSFCWGG